MGFKIWTRLRGTELTHDRFAYNMAFRLDKCLKPNRSLNPKSVLVQPPTVRHVTRLCPLFSLQNARFKILSVSCESARTRRCTTDRQTNNRRREPHWKPPLKNDSHHRLLLRNRNRNRQSTCNDRLQVISHSTRPPKSQDRTLRHPRPWACGVVGDGYEFSCKCPQSGDGIQG